MPCNSDYMEATGREVKLSRVACLLDELDGKPINKSYWYGYHPAVYNRHESTFNADEMVAELCSRLQKVDPTQYSLELQIWWRDHQKADKTRLEYEMARQKDEQDRKTALEKLTPYERNLLGLTER